MSSNDEHAAHGDLIEITTTARVDFGKRLQVVSSEPNGVTVLDNRARVLVSHGDYKVVRRCGRPGTVDAPAKRGRGRPSNAEREARLAGEKQLATAVTQTPPAVEIPAPVVTAKPVVTDADVAGLEAAIGAAQAPADIDVPVTRKQTVLIGGRQSGKTAAIAAAQANTSEAPKGASSQARAPAEHVTADKTEPGKLETASVGDLIELLKPVGGYPTADWLEVTEASSVGCVTAIGGKTGDGSVVVLDGEYRIVERAETMADRARDLRFPRMTEGAQWHQQRIAQEAQMSHDHLCDATRYGIGAARVSFDLRSNQLTQEQIDAMTTHTEPRGFVAIDLALANSEYPNVAKPDARKHSHYFKPCPFDEIDVYRVLERFNVTDQAIGHALKKLLVAGGRGQKDIGKDVQEAIDTLERWKEMRAEEVEASAREAA